MMAMAKLMRQSLVMVIGIYLAAQMDSRQCNLELEKINLCRMLLSDNLKGSDFQFREKPESRNEAQAFPVSLKCLKKV
jgi:hypothetical protein